MESSELSAIETGILGDYWTDFQYAVQQKLDISEAALRHFHVKLDGRFSFQDDSVLVSGSLLSSWRPMTEQVPCLCVDKVVIRMSLSNWYAVGQHSSSLRILNCPLIGENRPPVLDTTLGTAVIAAGVTMRVDECVQVAELFSGGFMGWSQGISVLQHHNIPVRLRWAIDSNPLCGRSFVAQHDGATTVAAKDGAEPLAHQTAPVFLNAMIQEDWWLLWPARNPVDIWCSSPPCQPWSTAGSQQGLHDQDGKLILRLLSLMQIFQPAVVCIEEVVGFRKHSHFAFVKQCWEDIGYIETWHQNVDLIDFAPQSRNRCLLVLTRQDAADKFPKLQGRPVMPRRPTLGSFDCLLQLCPALQQACHLEPTVLSMYLDPYYSPPSKFARTGSDPIAHRIVTSSGRVSTIMAQYHKQHALPETSLARGGIIGNLLRDHQGLRFLSGAEIALIHCCQEPFFMPQDDAQLMLFVGNSLSVPQAILPLALAVSSLQPVGLKVDPLQAVQWAVGERMRASQIVILPLRDGWVLCKQCQVQEALSRLRPSVPWGQLSDSNFGGTQVFWVRDDFDTIAILKSPGFSLPHLLESIGIQYDESNLQEIRLAQVVAPLQSAFVDKPPEESILVTPCIPEIRSTGIDLHVDTRTGPPLLVILGMQAVYVIAAAGPAIAASLHGVAFLDGLDPLDGKALWHKVDHCPVHRWRDFDQTVVLVHDSYESPISMPDCHRDCFEGVKFMTYVDPVRLFLPQAAALQIGAGFPTQHAVTLGWYPRLIPANCGSDRGISVLFQPQPHRMRLRQEDLAHWCADVLPRLSECQTACHLLC